jgi:uroporphyrinogen III methyltransferase/synthase
VAGTLADLPDKVAAAGLKPPAVTIVGAVAGLRQELAWWERLPLAGRRVLVTRTRKQASALSAGLRELGAQVVEIPTIEILPPEDPRPLADAAAEVERYQWLVFTSPNGAEAFFGALAVAGKDARALHGAKVAAIGPATARAIRERGVEPEVVAKSFVAEGLLEALAGFDLQGRRVLVPRAAQARQVLPETLASRGAVVEVVPAYRTVAPEESAGRLARALEEGLDAVTFTSSSTATNLMALLDEQGRQELIRRTRAGELVAASIGPITSRTAQGLGLAVQVEPAAYTIPDLIQALAGHFAARA